MANIAMLCLDETGSMTGQEHRVVMSLNEYVDKLPEDCRICVFTFDSQRWRRFYDGYKTNWVPMQTSDYKPGAATPLYDAIASTIQHAEVLAAQGDKVMIMIDTDGEENASKEHTRESINALVSQKKGVGWEFRFMANGIDEQQARHVGTVGGDLGMSVSASSYDARVDAYRDAASATQAYFSKQQES